MSEIESFRPESQENLTLNVKLLRMLLGHRGLIFRQLINKSKSAESLHLKKIYQLAKESSTDDENLGLNNNTVSSIPESLQTIEEAEQLYELLSFLEKNPETPREEIAKRIAEKTANCLNLPGNTKWKDMIDPLFYSENPAQIIKDLLDQIGSLPHEFFIKQKFKNLSPEALFKFIGALRELENDPKYLEQVKYERARLLNQIFISRLAEKRKTPETATNKNISLDSNGVMINLVGLHSHLPYGLIEDETLKALQENGWIKNPSEILEIEYQRSSENSLNQKKEQASVMLVEIFAKSIDLPVEEGAELDKIITAIFNNPEEMAKKIVKAELVIPDQIIDAMANSKDPQKILALARLAEAITTEITEEKLTRKAGLFLTHDLSTETESSYQARAAIMNSPVYYNVTKIARILLTSGAPTLNAENFALIRGRYKKAKRTGKNTTDQHTFIEVLHEGQVARLLINEDKHLGPKETESLDSLPLYAREDYEKLEYAIRAFHYYTSTVANLEKTFNQQKKNWQKRFTDLAETALHFLLTNVTEFRGQALTLYKSIEAQLDQSPKEKIGTFLILLKEAQKRYSIFLYQNINQPNTYQEHFAPEVREMSVTFGETFLQEARKECLPYGFDENLCTQAKETRVSVLKTKQADPSRTIPFHVEESCLDAIRLDRNRPLINVIGGCRELDAEKNPLEKFSNDVLTVAHRYSANVAVPGTQSGIGTLFGRKNMQYRSEFDHLPENERAHVFAVSPGVNTYFPGSPFSQNTSEEIYAITPVDSIITPYGAGWGVLEGRKKIHSPYRNHIDYMESLYARLARDQKKVMVVGNGGLYSIMEINESLKYGFDLLLIRDSGRFAEIASLLLEKIDKIDIDDDASIYEALQKGNLEKQVLEEFLRKDFGSNVTLNETKLQDENFEVYRLFLKDFLRIAKERKGQIKVTTLENLEKDLDNFLAEK